MSKMIKCVIDSIRVSLTNQDRVVVLKQVDAERYLPIFIGLFESESLTIALQGVRTARPLTHNLLLETRRPQTQIGRGKNSLHTRPAQNAFPAAMSGHPPSPRLLPLSNLRFPRRLLSPHTSPYSTPSAAYAAIQHGPSRLFLLRTVQPVYPLEWDSGISSQNAPAVPCVFTPNQ